MKHIKYLKLILYMMKPWMNLVSLSSDIVPFCICIFAGSDLAQRLSVGFIIWGVMVQAISKFYLEFLNLSKLK